MQIHPVCIKPGFSGDEVCDSGYGESKDVMVYGREVAGAGQIFESNGTLVQTQFVLNPDF
jgi:hypothetical protein